MKVTEGDAITALLNDDVDLLIHIANCQGRMGSGIALSIKTRIPSAYDAYKLFEKERTLTLGTVSSDNKVVNLHAQKYYGYDGKRYIDYEALALCLESIKNTLDKRGKSYRIAVPYRMGCDRAGGSWGIVKSMISQYLLPDHQILIYKLK